MVLIVRDGLFVFVYNKCSSVYPLVVVFFSPQLWEVEYNTVFTWLELSFTPDMLLSEQNLSGASGGLSHIVASVFDWKSLKIGI